MAIYAVWRDEQRKVRLVVGNGPADAVEALVKKALTKCLNREYNPSSINGVYFAARLDTLDAERVIVEENYGSVQVWREE